jgi:hypothetical protein
VCSGSSLAEDTAECWITVHSETQDRTFYERTTGLHFFRSYAAANVRYTLENDSSYNRHELDLVMINARLWVYARNLETESLRDLTHAVVLHQEVTVSYSSFYHAMNSNGSAAWQMLEEGAFFETCLCKIHHMYTFTEISRVN